MAQSTTATLAGNVSDEKDDAVPGATVKIINTDAGFERTVTTNSNGTFTVPLLPPATYRITVERTGFAPFEVSEVTLNATDQKSLNIRLKVGQVGESVQVTTEAPLIDDSPTVRTTIDRQFVQNLPLNGRSLQTLIALAPGVVNTPQASNGGQPGQFSVNGQRTNANNFTVDGMSGNFSAPTFGEFGQRGSGSVPAADSQGAFSSLASVDAIQEFSIQTSTFAPEFGRNPGAQVSIVTRGGENKFHGSLFEFFRNDKLDANDFFNNQAGIPRQKLRYNNFGGTLGGPVILPRFGEGGPSIWKGTDKTFFFFSYEGQRFVLPQPTVTITVPSLSARQNAPNAISRALLNAFPLPNGAVVLDGAGDPVGGQYTTAFSDPNNTDTYGLRIDHNFNNKFTIFGRVNVSNSSANRRSTDNVSQFNSTITNSKTFTVGSNQIFRKSIINEFRANYSIQRGDSQRIFDGFGGGTEPDPNLLLPSGVNASIFFLLFDPFVVFNTGNRIGRPNQNEQYEIVDNVLYPRGGHQIKFGGDYRRLLPKVSGGNSATVIYFSTPDIYDNLPFLTSTGTNSTFTSKFETYGFYGQDTWKINKRATMTYGLRWEINPAPTGIGDRTPFTLAAAPDLSKLDQSSLQLAPAGTPYYKTKFANFAPRFGLSYLLREKPGQELVLRGGIGTFFDIGQSGFGTVGFPYNQGITRFFTPVPISPALFNFPTPSLTLSPTNQASVTAAAADYTLPRTYQWNFTAEQSIGKNQALSVAYVGALGRKLVRTRRIDLALPGQEPNVYFSPNFSSVTLIQNDAESSYHSMQAQFTSRLSQGLQVLANYTWSHSIDNASNDNEISAPGFIYPADVNRGDSDFDIRHNFSGALSYDIRTPNLGKIGNTLLRNWSLNGIFTIHSGLPYTVQIQDFTFSGNLATFRRPNLTGQPLYVSEPNVATGRRLNPAAFDFSIPSPQMGNLGRNSLRGENFFQVDLGLHRNFKFGEKVNLELRAEAFNVFNRANFLYPTVIAAQNDGGFVTIPSDFGLITSSAARAFNPLFGTGFSPLFQAGGPRSIQLAFRLSF